MAWYNNAHIGQRIVALATWKARPNLQHLPQRGRVYTVRAITYHEADGVGVFLQEFVNDPYVHGGLMQEPTYDADHFKPVDESRLDEFRKLLVNIPRTVDA